LLFLLLFFLLSPPLSSLSNNLGLAEHQETPEERAAREDRQLHEALKNRKKLLSASELAKGIEFSEPMKTSWRPPRRFRDMPLRLHDEIRRKWHIDVEGLDLLPPIRDFKVASLLSAYFPFCLWEALLSLFS